MYLILLMKQEMRIRGRQQIDQLSFLEKALVNYPLRMNQILFLELIIQVGTDLIGLLKAMGSYYLKFESMVVIFSLNLGYTVEMGKQFDFLVAAAAVVVGAREKETGIVLSVEGENKFCRY